LDLSKELDNTLPSSFPRLEKFLEDISSIDSIAEYLNKRPKLIIDGVAHPTGIMKT